MNFCREPHPTIEGVICLDEKGHSGIHAGRGNQSRYVMWLGETLSPEGEKLRMELIDAVFSPDNPDELISDLKQRIFSKYEWYVVHEVELWFKQNKG